VLVDVEGDLHPGGCAAGRPIDLHVLPGLEEPVRIRDHQGFDTEAVEIEDVVGRELEGGACREHGVAQGGVPVVAVVVGGQLERRGQAGEHHGSDVLGHGVGDALALVVAGFVRLALRPAPSEVPAPDAPASSGNLATLTRASLDSEGGELAISVGIVRKPEMSIDFPLAAAPSAVPLDWCWPPEWRIGGRAMPTGHWRWSASLLAAMMVWLEKLRWQFGPVESSHRSVTLAQLVFDFEIATGHMLPAPGEVSSSVSHRSSLCIALRMRTISFYIRALLKYARKPGTDIVFEPEWKEHDNVLVQYGGLPLSSMAARPILVNEEAVRGMVTSWIRATASHVTDARAQANQSARAAPGHRRASSLRPAGGPRAWIPSYPEAPLESKLLYEAVMARRRSLALRGAGVKREAKLLASAREREIKRVEHNYKACPQGRHLIYPVVADSFTLPRSCQAHLWETADGRQRTAVCSYLDGRRA